MQNAKTYVEKFFSKRKDQNSKLCQSQKSVSIMQCQYQKTAAMVTIYLAESRFRNLGIE